MSYITGQTKMLMLKCFTQNYQCESHSGTKGKVRGRSDLVEFILRGP